MILHRLIGLSPGLRQAPKQHWNRSNRFFRAVADLVDLPSVQYCKYRLQRPKRCELDLDYYETLLEVDVGLSESANEFDLE